MQDFRTHARELNGYKLLYLRNTLFAPRKIFSFIYFPLMNITALQPLELQMPYRKLALLFDPYLVY